ncbi:APC family permease [Pediococcus pentosaceus]|jgi:amino acid transporter|uniref:APC family permease n=3 Tax=Pediococcus pentosaceus TaxID=1255 RepID=A0A1Y0VVY1_PEDPE|nr:MULTISPECIES: APC family permease [Pediococcus]ABJ67518.1 amino acid/polyamine/organocation transporter, APC superfamily [Pediococcus pentosaceus ATCC 25745]AHA04660.1 amino acid permease [Pediococcus pentosaceus SL4]ANI98326.1 amino acid permease [Pediococcus pentosaceus]ARW20286.1 putative amino acid permease YdaO [Pediococcus pentosaceus]ASC08920.1 putative amino acid permease YdaO [Pediococcus pentosaceus]
MFSYLKRILIGKPLKTLDESGQALTKFKALALLSSDALSSIAYGTEEILSVLIVLSAAATWYSIPIAGIVLVLLFAITVSYRQIIKAYPSGGGAYVVASKNWGTSAGLVAGGSLLVDYMLTVAVSVTSGTEAITSAIPALQKYHIAIAVLIVLGIMALNLRGLRESASFLTIPVYLFIVVISLMIVVGLYNIATGQVAYHAASAVGSAVPGMTFVIFLRALSSGSSSLTGVEAISNAVPNFKKPRRKNAAGTLAIMSLILASFFAGITFLAYYSGITPSSSQTVLSQIGVTIFGHGIFYYILQLSTALILAVAANTGFSAFPMLAYNLAKDKFMPHAYMDRGDRLGYSNGIISLAAGAIVLILIFGGQTGLLIPLYAIGVFVPFTLSQSGMIVHWKREGGKKWMINASANLLGALLSAVLVICLLFLHFSNVWPYFIVMPLLLRMFYKIRKHYDEVADQLRVIEKGKVNLHDYDGSTVIVLVSNVTQVTSGAINYARSIGDYVIAMHVSFDANPEKEHKTAMEFKAEYPDVRFIDIHSSYRSITNPTLRFCDVIARRAAERNYTTTVLVPQFVPRKPWQNILHNQTGLRLRASLNSRENIIVSTYNYHLK